MGLMRDVIGETWSNGLMTISPLIFQGLTMVATGCLLIALAIGREDLGRDRGLRRGIVGLLVSSITGVVLAFGPPQQMVWPLVFVMTGGLVAVIVNVRVKAKSEART
jgi:multisubunit Na+/H+ antiporter MnhB subunit